MKRTLQKTLLCVTAVLALASVSCAKKADSAAAGEKKLITLTVFTEAARQQPNADNKVF